MVETLSPGRLRDLLADDASLALIDIREPLDYANANIHAATPVPRPHLEQRIRTLVPNFSTMLILVDREGDRAKGDATWLESNGYHDVWYLDGGMAAWVAAGYPIVEAIDGAPTSGFNFTSKRFAEIVDVTENLPKVTAETLLEWKQTKDPLIVDVRTPFEYQRDTIPDAIHIEGVDVGLYLDSIRETTDQPVVVHCGGRTRSIIGASTLRKLGIENVYELENGTVGWLLAGLELERNADRMISDISIDPDRRAERKRNAEQLFTESGGSMIDLAGLDRLLELDDPDSTVYLVDVRTEAEYAVGHVPGALSIPGGEAIQRAEKHFAVRNADIVCISDEHIRAAIAGYWINEMGFGTVHVLADGIDTWEAAGRELTRATPERSLIDPSDFDAVALIDPETLQNHVTAVSTHILHIGTSEQYRDRHVPSSVWVPRYELEQYVHSIENTYEQIVLTCSTGSISTCAGLYLTESNGATITVLDGGLNGWESAGLDIETESGEFHSSPRDVAKSASQTGSLDAMRAYVEWEEALGHE